MVSSRFSVKSIRLIHPIRWNDDLSRNSMLSPGKSPWIWRFWIDKWSVNVNIGSNLSFFAAQRIVLFGIDDELCRLVQKMTLNIIPRIPHASWYCWLNIRHCVLKIFVQSHFIPLKLSIFSQQSHLYMFRYTEYWWVILRSPVIPPFASGPLKTAIGPGSWEMLGRGLGRTLFRDKLDMNSSF